MNVHQLSIAYVSEQDRILVRVNTREGRELQCWFTRRLTLGVQPLMDKAVAEQSARHGGVAPARLAAMDDLARKAVAQFERGETLSNADFATPYKASEAVAPLFNSPLLVTEVNLAYLHDGQLRSDFRRNRRKHAYGGTIDRASQYGQLGGDSLRDACAYVLARHRPAKHSGGSEFANVCRHL